MAKDVMGRFCEYVYANVETLTSDVPFGTGKTGVMNARTEMYPAAKLNIIG